MRLNLDADKLRRHQAFLKRETSDRPLIGSWLYGFYIDQQYPRVAAAMRPGEIRPEDIPIDLFMEDVDALYAAYAELNDDYPFSMGAFYGIPWMEAIMGCPIHFSGTTMWANPCIADWAAYAWPRPDLKHNPWFNKLLEFLAALVAHSNGRFACGPTLMRGMADMCSAMREPNNLALDLYDCPDNIQRLAEVCADVWIETGQAQLALLPESENGYLVGCAGLRCWMPERGIWLQDDAIAVLSPKFYRKLFLPQVQRITSQFAHLAFHLHGNTLWPVDFMLDVEGIAVLELNYDTGACRFADVLAAWQKIQKRKPCLVWADRTPQELDELVDQLPPAGVSIQSLSKTMEEATAKRDRVYRRTAAKE